MSGHADNTSDLLSAGAAGGGIIIIISDKITMFTHKVSSAGFNGPYCYANDCNDGMGGGGAGGTILMDVSNIIGTLTINNVGGDGANIFAPVVPGGKVGPGGGGGAGALFMTSSTLPGNVIVENNGGINGVLTRSAADPWGATPGTNGLSFFNLVLPFDTALFKPNIDSVRIADSLITCNSFSFKGQTFTNFTPIILWHWDFGDGNIAVSQYAVHTYSSENPFPVKLIAADINVCKDSSTIIINPKIVEVDAGMRKQFCSNSPVTVTLNGNGNGSYAWTPALYLNDSTQQYPVAIINTTTTFYLTITHSGCSATDSVDIDIFTKPTLYISKSNDINCTLPYAKLNISGASQYLWSPAGTLSNSTADNPIANPAQTTMYFVTGTNNNGCTTKDSITIVADFSKGNIELPNTFTPNGDGVNDCFGIKYYRDVQNVTFIIYDRYGEKVFETKNAAECWDGYYKGQQIDPGNYVYYLSANTLCGYVVKKGSILLVR